MADLFSGQKLMKKEGKDSFKEVNADDHLKGKVVALYFSAHWCPPCRAFTPVLKDFYEDLADDPIEIVFVSFDKSDGDLKSYLNEAHGDWLFVPHGDPRIQELSTKFGVSGIPALLVVKPDGTVANSNGRGDVQSKGPNAFKEWKTACGI